MKHAHPNDYQSLNAETALKSETLEKADPPAYLMYYIRGGCTWRLVNNFPYILFIIPSKIMY